MTLKRFSLADQTFADIIDKNYFYVDKTRYIYELWNSEENSFFLSRPRRFGKTLFLYTLNELFSGNRERFKGLWIDQSDYDFPRLPVLFLSLSMGSASSTILERNLIFTLKEIASRAKINLRVENKAS
ncbi:MAG: AAA family ATPase, partial [Deltaproteobacteria bacterium]|nr:AAA family ATPase [Deltaproteobacteria bacterium]